MKLFIVSFFVLFHLCSHATELAKHYKSFDTDYVGNAIVVPYDNEQYLIYYNGFEHPIDGKVHLYTKSDNGINNGQYVFQMPNLNMTHFHSKGNSALMHGSLNPYFEVYLADKPMTKVVYYGRVSPHKVRDIKQTYLTQQGLLESKVAVKQSLKKASLALTTACGTSPTAKIDWSSFTTKKQKTTPGMLVGFFSAMTKLCQEDSDYKEAIAEIKSIDVSLASQSNKPSVSFANATLTITLDKDMPNIPQVSYKLLTDLL